MNMARDGTAISARATAEMDPSSVADHSSVTLQLAARESAENMHGMDEVYQAMRHRSIRVKAYALDDPQAPKEGNVKTIHFVRHGQGFHNLLADLYEEQGRKWVPYTNTPDNPYTRPELLDPPLTEKGRQQALSLQPHVQTLGFALPDLVVVSPLGRAVQTAVLVFEALWSNDISKVPFVAHELAREESGVHICDQRQPVSRLKATFPMVDFSTLETEEDPLFLNDQRETKLQVGERVYHFLVWLSQRPERNIGVVSHSSWLLTVFNGICETNDPKLKAWFQTGEMRSVVLHFIDAQQADGQCSK